MLKSCYANGYASACSAPRTVRDLASRYDTVNVAALRMTNVDGDRNIAIDSFPANMLARVEVVKAPTLLAAPRI